MSENTKPIPTLAGAELIDGVLCFRGVPVSDLEALPLELAARVAAVSAPTLREFVNRGRLRINELGNVSREDLRTFLRGGK